jgi:hypothetical protein
LKLPRTPAKRTHPAPRISPKAYPKPFQKQAYFQLFLKDLNILNRTNPTSNRVDSCDSQLPAIRPTIRQNLVFLARFCIEAADSQRIAIDPNQTPASRECAALNIPHLPLVLRRHNVAALRQPGPAARVNIGKTQKAPTGRP